jgi:hypothetical protein
MAGAGARMSGIGEMWRYKRVLTASLVGTAVEFYDFYIYATAASLIFPSPSSRVLWAQRCSAIMAIASGERRRWSHR